MATRISFENISSTEDYVDGRFEVLLDGAKVGEVTKNVESRDLSRTQDMLARMSKPSTRWSAEGVRSSDHSSRTDAVIDLLMYGMVPSMAYGEAARAAGRKGY